MIIDFHTHIFSSEVSKNREDYILRDLTFAEMYSSPRAKVATAEDLAESMQAAGVDVSVALGFSWEDHKDVVRHNDYLLETAIRGEGRIIPFCTINMLASEAESEIERVAAAGARGLGELRPESQGWDLNGAAGERLAKLAAQHGLALLFHVTEPAGHHYPGKYGLSLASFVRFASAHRRLVMIGAHLGGGLPLFVEREARPAVSHVVIDTAARGYLYTPEEYRLALIRAPENVLFGSDYPLLSQKKEIEGIRADTRDPSTADAVLGLNAARLLGLEG